MKKSLGFVLLSLCLVLAGVSSAFSTPIASGTVTLDGTESLTSTVRVYRNAIPSTWASPKSFPGTINDVTNYFETVSLTPGLLEFVRVTYEWLSGEQANIFLVGYLNSFDINNLSTNYLGDPGSSVLFTFPGPRIFEVFVPNGDSLVLAFDTVVGGLGSVSYSVEGFGAVPEPTTMLLLGSGLLGLWGARKKFKK
jgi:hypothetical protein